MTDPYPLMYLNYYIEQTAQAILDARALYPDNSLADLYDELTMPPELRRAHQQNDISVMHAYGWKKGDAAYSSEADCVAELMYLIGMMNTADRSLAMMDYALRRRFAFFEMKPGFDTEGFRAYRMRLGSDKFDRLISCVENLNAVIAADESLGEGFCIGHSYFCNLKEATDKALSGIVEFELIPLLKEYWFDEPVRVKDWTNNLRSAVK